MFTSGARVRKLYSVTSDFLKMYVFLSATLNVFIRTVLKTSLLCLLKVGFLELTTLRTRNPFFKTQTHRFHLHTALYSYIKGTECKHSIFFFSVKNIANRKRICGMCISRSALGKKQHLEEFGFVRLGFDIF